MICSSLLTKASKLALLNFSPAIDTIDHSVITHSLHNDLRHIDADLQSFSSNLIDRILHVSLSSHCSALTTVNLNAFWSLVFGHIILNMYIKLFAIIDSHSITHNC